MAGIGFELKKLFDKRGLVNNAKAFTYSSLVTVGPMLSCILLITIVQWLLVRNDASFTDRELFMAYVVYAFTFSYIITNLFSMFITRAISDFIYQGYYGALLASFRGSLKLNYLIGIIPALLFLILADLPFMEKVSSFVMYIILITIWTQTIFITAMKEIRKIVISFVTGTCISLLLVIVVLRWFDSYNIAHIIFAIDTGFFVTAGMLMIQIEQFFKTDKQLPSFSFFAYIRKYPSLIAIGTLTAIGLYSHQFVQWFGPKGRTVGGAFLMAPEYDIAVYYAFISAIPTLIMFVVSLETIFYPKFRSYYNAILNQGSITDIKRAMHGMYQILMQQLSMIMGVQLIFSIIAIALGIRFLPFIGFTSTQVDIFNILVLGFFAYIIFSIVTLVLLYFDDRKGAVWLAVVFLVLNTGLTLISVAIGEQGFSFFSASFLTLLLALGRLIYLLRNLSYFTFSSQPLVVIEDDNKYTRLLKQSEKVE
ncbi:exopolysaccharide Pel transporter PelG [Paenibacillus sp. CMAA1364]